MYLRWRAEWWESQKVYNDDKRPDLLKDDRQREGHDAYATRQARIMRSVAARFEKKCSGAAALIQSGRSMAAQAAAASGVESETDGSGEDGSGEEGGRNEDDGEEGGDEMEDDEEDWR